MENNFKIFSFCHDSRSFGILTRNLGTRSLSPEYYQIVACGGVKNSMKSDGFEPLGDDSGDNISKYNRNFNEMTGMYWLAYNYDLPEYVGIQHYRRMLNVDEDFLNRLEPGRIFLFEGSPEKRCDATYSEWQEWDFAKKMNLHLDLRIANYDNPDVYPDWIKNLITPYIAAGSPGVQYKYMAVMPKKVFTAMLDFFKPVINHYIDVIDSGKYGRVNREFGFVLEYLYSHFINIYSKMFRYDLEYVQNGISYMP